MGIRDSRYDDKGSDMYFGDGFAGFIRYKNGENLGHPAFQGLIGTRDSAWAHSAEGGTHGNCGGAAGDFNEDGLTDLYVTRTFFGHRLFFCTGGGGFVDVSADVPPLAKGNPDGCPLSTSDVADHLPSASPDTHRIIHNNNDYLG